MSQSPTLTLEPSPELVDLIAHRAAELVEPPGPEPYLNKAAMADRLYVSVRWLEERLREGMPSVMLAGSRKFRASEVERWLEATGHIERGVYDARLPTNRGRAARTTAPMAREESMPPTSNTEITHGGR